MQQLEDKSWIEKFGGTAPIKNIMNCVDELEKNYERRLSELNAEYQRDVEEILENYRIEKHQFQIVNEDLIEKLETVYVQLAEEQRKYQAEQVEHKITKDKLQETRQELKVLSCALKSEQELIEITEQKVKTMNEQMAIRLEFDLNLAPEQEPKPTSKTSGFFKKIFSSRKPKPITQEEESATAEPVSNE